MPQWAKPTAPCVRSSNGPERRSAKNDLWIAAHARGLDVTLVTNNTREFARVPKLKLQNWAE
jgi:predicted nucleic acid-binding protein